MSKFHIDKNGKPSVCNKNEKGECSLGDYDESNHFDSREDAQKAADYLNEQKYGLLPKTL